MSGGAATHAGDALAIAVAGASGRVGRRLVALTRERTDVRLVGASVRPGSTHAGADAGELAGGGPLGIACGESFDAALEGARVAIDFTTPDALALHARLCARRGVALVVGTTGLGAAEQAELRRAAERVPVVAAPNMSLGVNVLFGVARRVAAALGEGWDAEVVELHHRDKKDAPGGTALRLASEICAARGFDPAAAIATTRPALRAESRPREEVGVVAARGGDAVGEHTVYLFGRGERLELTHRATDRDIFARGALVAARWAAAPAREPALYDMLDVLGLR